MKIGLTGHYHQDFKSFLIGNNFEIDTSKTPNIMLVYGGDGSLLGAEREYPKVPKFPIRDSNSAPLCSIHSHKKQIELLRTSQLKKTELIKIAGFVNGKKVFTGINDIFVHNTNRVSAVRYAVFIDDELYAEEIVGDGLGLSTPFGSSAYYRSITGSIFRVGLGLAFSNSTEAINHLVLSEDSIIKVKILRGPSILTCDNSNQNIKLKEGDEIIIKKDNAIATIYGLDIFMCKDCRTLRLSRQCKFLRDGER